MSESCGSGLLHLAFIESTAVTLTTNQSAILPVLLPRSLFNCVRFPSWPVRPVFISWFHSNDPFDSAATTTTFRKLQKVSRQEKAFFQFVFLSIWDFDSIWRKLSGRLSFFLYPGKEKEEDISFGKQSQGTCRCSGSFFLHLSFYIFVTLQMEKCWKERKGEPLTLFLP